MHSMKYHHVAIALSAAQLQLGILECSDAICYWDVLQAGPMHRLINPRVLMNAGALCVQHLCN
jgi:hypothetical protein